ncbi:DUF7922 domain-containing protein [Alkaliphilus serpentinus]|uniref:DUF7922 domain-containing protein n=1 Tax=Alkaliphilus serpentinus TaxID=1482731 RepID=A0A833HQI3_9FIRM|nr:hypothetical protein [Alkaliphilus serpentinus]KAB3531827.1 hypothetical protein F8153_03670 [Alkaliphilus serpentinus]
MKRRYRRFFVILEGEDVGYEKVLSDALKGYAKIEIYNERGTMALICQNLKSTDGSNQRYRWYLINAKGDKEPTIVDIGPMAVDNSGKGEVVWEFNCDNVKGSGVDVEDFNLLVLLAETIGGDKELEAPLVGYIDKVKINWKPMVERKMFGSFKKDQLVVEEKSLMNEEKPTYKETKGQEIKLEEEKPIIDSAPLKAKPLEANRDDTNYADPNVGKGYSFEEDRITSPQYKEADPQQQHNYSEKSILKSLQDYIEGTLKMFPKVNPFQKNLDNYHWWQIHYNYQTIYRSYMPFIAYIDGMRQAAYYHPYQYPSEYHRQIYMYQHYIFGIAYDNNQRAVHYVYGIPGKKTMEEQPYRGATGFEYWHPCSYEGGGGTNHGYWLLHIDVNTGKVVTPLKKTEL